MQRIAFLVLLAAAGVAVQAQDNSAAGIIAREREYYSVTALPTPPGAVLEVSGLELMPDGRLAVATRRGEI